MTACFREDWDRPEAPDVVSPLTLLLLCVREFLALVIGALGYLYLLVRW